jgi:tRNA threonylcarbamoyladenosine biosynthesis protein TsaB
MKVFGIDTAVGTGSVAIVEDDVLIAEVLLTSRQTHARRIMKAVDTVLAMTGSPLSDLDGFAVSVGPGSFTGLRIGISTVKGLAFSVGKPITAVTTLDALAFQFPYVRTLICPMLNARKKAVYVALYRAGQDGAVARVSDYKVISPLDWLSCITEPCLFVGDGMAEYGSLIKQKMGILAHFAPPFLNTIRASVIASIGMERLKNEETDDAETLVPFYIRPSDAEIKRARGSLSLQK